MFFEIFKMLEFFEVFEFFEVPVNYDFEKQLMSEVLFTFVHFVTYLKIKNLFGMAGWKLVFW